MAKIDDFAVKHLVIKHRKKIIIIIKSKLKLPFQNPFSLISDTCLIQSLAEEDAHKNMNLINDTKIVFFLKLQKRFIHSFF